MATIEIDGKTLEAENGKMIIEVADDAGIYIPRFCYHKKLSVAANCRMCLVEVENGRKPVPACATPITNGMKVFTKSPEAVRSQQAVMEFLLINHPLDCPICDQGGECELQDISLGFGYSNSEYEESKRAVVDDDLGTLIATEMTRCIHCTRCVRFGTEIAGVRELGALGRGEKMQIGTYINHSMTSEVSGNVIDLCPVGALTSKPYRFTARPWELTQHDSVAPHDCLGSNVHVHVRNNHLMRVVPKENEQINEMWISDRDRFSYLGLLSPNRAARPLIKRNGQWEEVDWPTALKFTADGISRIIKQHGAEQFAAFASPSATLEEAYLLQKLMRALGVNNLDHRIHQTDFRDQEQLPVLMNNTLPYAELEKQAHILLIGCNVNREVPLALTRIYKAQQDGAKVYSINPVDYDFPFDTEVKEVISPLEIPQQIAKLILAVSPKASSHSNELKRLLIGLEPDESSQILADALKQPKSVIVLGALAENHPHAALIRTLIYNLEQLTGVKVIQFTTGANAKGAHLAGMLPHRGAAGKSIEHPGLDIQSALDNKLKGYFLLGLEPSFDFENSYGARQSMLGAEFVVMLSAFNNESMRDYANVILPVAPYTETSGTYINIDNTWQSVQGSYKPFAEARPAWKVLRVLGNLLHCDEFEYTSSEEVLTEVKSAFNMMSEIKYQPYYPESLPVLNQQLVRVGEWPLYRIDSIVRHAEELQVCAAADVACIRMHPDTANRLKLDDVATVSQGNIEITLPLKRDERIALEVVWVTNAMPETADLGHSFAAITIKR
ncbi:NADH dehydrogenase I chain G [Legionella beliardensis]|uniref:NADH-quinone oxidoreductase n=1 Tax=Legionella beliardensis TaxID=91822 RepID=A0A378ICR0_9GAMM|nr:NADH-quinone oxidoreductase subunit NuoG [Legionella beliardensis]STX30084.1 NADH dehydrogenase I chain G [Legionella beliardensis]